ncbi:uncharacterized protein LOC113291074 [Papaver somniferum]|uniref:uncharacterized protein LOC113291074 n=1 Tax=Papaver somniferum TaxID=3469 RepID=UPI000E6FFAF2|nr:uncharacterized protein LOC113291074 [Papaver somniferum]
MDYNDHERIWDMQKIETYFEDHCIPNIITIEIKSGKEDQLTWTLEQKGCFTTKSLYNKLIRVGRKEDAQAQRMWKEIWSINVMPRIKTFIWKCLLSILPLNERIGHIIYSINKLCSNRGKQEETLTHLFMYYDFTLAVYDRLGLHMLYLQNTDLDFHRWFLNFLYIPSHDISYKGNNVEVIGTAMWGIWKARCDWVFDKKTLNISRTADLSVTIININRNTKLNLENSQEIEVKRSRVSVKPDCFTIKVNIVCATRMNSNSSAIALITSDNTGDFLGGKTLPAVADDGPDLEEQEASTIIQWLRQLNHPNVQIDSDNEKVLEAISLQVLDLRNNRIKMHGDNTKNFILCINSIYSINLIPVVENHIACKLASKSLNLSVICNWYPQTLKNFLPTLVRQEGNNIIVM